MTRSASILRRLAAISVAAASVSAFGGTGARAVLACDLGLATPDALAASFESRSCDPGDALIFIAAGGAERAAAMIGRFCDLGAQIVTTPGPGPNRTIVCRAAPKPLRSRPQ